MNSSKFTSNPVNFDVDNYSECLMISQELGV